MLKLTEVSLKEKARRAFDASGVAVIPQVFSIGEIEKIKAEVRALERNEPCPDAIVYEAHRLSVRGRHGDHLNSPVLHDLTRLDRLRGLAEHVLQSPVYVYQFKINTKAALCGVGWPWHEDFIYWQREDGLPSDKILTMGIFLTDVGRFNGPMLFLRGSHKRVVADVPCNDQVSGRSLDEFVGAELRYTISKPDLSDLWEKYSIVTAEGATGSVVVFSSRIVHCSPDNISPFDRDILFITYSATQNTPALSERPEFLVARTFEPLTPLDEETL
jgi:ectoine hydroxylase